MIVNRIIIYHLLTNIIEKHEYALYKYSELNAAAVNAFIFYNICASMFLIYWTSSNLYIIITFLPKDTKCVNLIRCNAHTAH